MAGVAALVLVACVASRFEIVFDSYSAAAGAGLLLLGAAYYYRNHRVDLKLGSALESTAQVLVVTARPAFLHRGQRRPIAARRRVRCHGSCTRLQLECAARFHESLARVLPVHASDVSLSHFADDGSIAAAGLHR